MMILIRLIFKVLYIFHYWRLRLILFFLKRSLKKRGTPVSMSKNIYPSNQIGLA